MSTTTRAVGSSDATAASPFAPEAGAALAASGAGVYGACSVETFADTGGLTYTHEDAQGFLAYVTQFTPPNFWFKDGNVKHWEYTEPYDDWQATYGLDAVKVFYHSGHGGMSAGGVFTVPLGATWGGETRVRSNQMNLGNERLRYLFWSTCESLRVKGGHSPIRTWSAPNRGVRMIFGWETLSWDWPDYGTRFWEHWRAGKSFSTAWLDAGYDGGRDQAPSVVACGASAAEAQDRVFNERLFHSGAPSTAWWWWRWYDAQTVRGAARDARALAIPSQARRVRFAATSTAFAARLANAGEVIAVRPEHYVVRVADPRHLETAGPADATNDGRAITSAAAAVDALGLGDDVDLRVDHVRRAMEAGGRADARPGAAQVSGYVVELRQFVDGHPVVTPDQGYVRVALDAGARVTHLDVAVRPVADIVDAAIRREPGDADAGADATDAAAMDLSSALDEATTTALARRYRPGRRGRLTATDVPGTTEVGYHVEGDAASLVVQAGREVSFGRGIRKRIWVRVPLAG